MNQQEQQARIHQFETLCKGRGLPVTSQRRLVLEEFLQSREHPSAEQLFRSVRGRHPTISQTTVYRVLELLVGMGLARRTCSPGSPCRYDPVTDRHHHLVCMQCERIVDLESRALDEIPLPGREKTGFEVVDYSVHFLGTCPECLTGRPRPGQDES